MNQSIWLNWDKNDQKERTYDHTGSSHSALPPKVGLSFTRLSDGRTIQAAKDRTTGVIYINTWKSTVTRYCSEGMTVNHQQPLGEAIQWGRERQKLSESTETIKLRKIMLIDLPTWKSTRRPCPRFMRVSRAERLNLPPASIATSGEQARSNWNH